jgi:hypothetical protein
VWSNAEIHEWANSGGLGCGARTCPTTLGVFPVFFRDCGLRFLECLNGPDYLIANPVSHDIPELFDGIQFWAGGWQHYDPDIVQYTRCYITMMKTCAVISDYMDAAGVSCSYLAHKKLVAFQIYPILRTHEYESRYLSLTNKNRQLEYREK